MKLRAFHIAFFIALGLQAGELPKADDSGYRSDFEEEVLTRWSEGKPMDPFLFMLASSDPDDQVLFSKGLMEAEGYVQWFNAQVERTGDEVKALKALFQKVHKEKFQRYSLYAPFGAIISSNTYNCVSGTGYLAYLLTKAGYKPEIWETAHHTYLKITDLEKGSVLIETTDPAFGFVTSEKKLAQMEAEFARFDGTWGIISNPEPTMEAGEATGTYARQITFTQLGALNYFNKGALNLENGQIEEAHYNFQMAYFIYPSERTAKAINLFVVE